MARNASAVYGLSHQTQFICQGCGACCTANWPIPVEDDCARLLSAGVGSGALGLPASLSSWGDALEVDGCEALLRRDGRGHCAFFESDPQGSCGIQRQMGAECLPAACRHFPRVCTLDPTGVAVTLSHYCPAVARSLIGAGSVRVVEASQTLSIPGGWEGLDGRCALPPLLRPERLMCWESYALWERHSVQAVQSWGRTVEDAVDALARDAERLREWCPGRVALPDAVRTMGEARSGGETARGVAWAIGECIELHALAVDCVPKGLKPADDGVDLCQADAAWVGRRWQEHGGIVRTYLASKAFASWVGRLGHGVRTSVAALKVAAGVLRVEAARACAQDARALDEELLLAAVRRADLILVHLLAPALLAERLRGMERARAWSPELPLPGRPG